MTNQSPRRRGRLDQLRRTYGHAGTYALQLDAQPLASIANGITNSHEQRIIYRAIGRKYTPARKSLRIKRTSLTFAWMHPLPPVMHTFNDTMCQQELHANSPAFKPLIPTALLPYIAFVSLFSLFLSAFYFTT